MKIIDTTSLVFIKAIKALLRYYYSETEYHSTLGGDDFCHHLSMDNPILVIPDSFSDLDTEEFLLTFLEILNQDRDISIYTAYGRNIYNFPPKTAVSVGKSKALDEIVARLANSNYYLVEGEFEKSFHSISEHVEAILMPKTSYYRARIGSILKASNFDWKKMRHEEEFHEAYRNSEIGAPPIHLAKGGRINRPGVSYLYLSTDAETAVSEVRPHPGENVSVGEFKSTQELKIADFSQLSLTQKLFSDDGLDALELMIAIQNTLSKAVSPSMNRQYSVTQFIAEIVRKIGFDGLAFKSSVSGGKNYVVFNPETFEWVSGSGRVFRVTAVSYTTEAQQYFDTEEDYDLIYN
ncbi:RES family NAD+ phosphorylase [Marinobacter sp. GN3S48]|uniref:RES family NAD+ phosphorylase n=1 Tax=Marinobacter sp. GN3S48 TaxID=3382302 RepID=UPI00387B1A5C